MEGQTEVEIEIVTLIYIIIVNLIKEKQREPFSLRPIHQGRLAHVRVSK